MLFRWSAVVLGLVAVLAAGGGGSAPAEAAPALQATAADVVVRGMLTFDKALRAAVALRPPDAPAPPMVVVIDSTPNTRKGAATIADALSGLQADPRTLTSLRITGLGHSLSGVLKDGAAVRAAVAEALEQDTTTDSTLSALRKTIGALQQPGTVVIYVADWHFEDDSDLEGVVELARGRGFSLSTVGTEAAFLRGWLDGFIDPLERALGDGAAGDGYQTSVGRSPFGPEKASAPWHGGETAYPSLPYAWNSFFWDGEFQGIQSTTPEDLRERLGRDPRSLAASARRFPLPSAFGPYGLMRLAAETGGRYVLWSWNPSGRSRVKYEYPRCNLFLPDLRARKTILQSMGEDGLGKAMIAAWHDLSKATARLVEVTPPLKPDARTPGSIDRVDARGLGVAWDSLAEHRECLKTLAAALDSVGSASATLDKAISAAGEPSTDFARRRQAEAMLLRHTLAAVAFEVAEATLAARSVTPEAWETRGQVPGLSPRPFIPGSASGLSALISRARGVEALDPQAGEAIRSARTAHLARFRGTPFGAQVEMNDVSTYRIAKYREGEPVPRGRTPSESGGSTTPTPAGGGSSGGGPATGK